MNLYPLYQLDVKIHSLGKTQIYLAFLWLNRILHQRYTAIGMLAAALLMLIPSPVSAKGGNGKKSGIVKLVYGLKNLIDTMAVSGLDPEYIYAPERPWQIIAKSNVNQSILKMKSTVNGDLIFGEGMGETLWESRIKTEAAVYVGLWAGYRGYGLGYYKNVRGDKGSYLTLGATGGRYGVNVRIHNFETKKPLIHFKGDYDGIPIDVEDEVELFEPISVHTVIADGYYLFNGKRFSYSAAYDQAVVQRRSAGSLMAGAMFYHISIDYAKDRNAGFINLMNDIGRFKQWLGGVGVGYAYNFVPAKGLLINAMAMPVLVFYNRSTAYMYDSNVNKLLNPEDFMNEYEENETGELADKFKITPNGKSSKNNNVTVNYNARMSIVYNWKRFFVNATGQFNHFRYKKDRYNGWLNDWFVNVSLGIRL